MSSTLHSHSHRKRIARVYVVCIFVLLAGATALLLQFAIQSHDSMRNFIGPVFGYGMACTLLLAGVWRRLGWSRYVLIGLNWLMLIGFALTAVLLAPDPQRGGWNAFTTFAPPLLIFIVANTWLIKSKRIRQLVTPPDSAG